LPPQSALLKRYESARDDGNVWFDSVAIGMKEQDLRRLGELTGLMLDHRLAVLRKAAEAKAQSETALAALSRPMPEGDGLVGASAELSALAYERWADARRAEINQQLARQTHIWMEARDAAQIAFGKAEALRRLRDRQQ
jgi:hypothetical protein